MVIQFYLMSVILNSVCGLYLLSDNSLEEKGETESITVKNFIYAKKFPFFLGVFTAITAILVLLGPMDVLVVGDLLPAVAGFVGGCAILYEYYQFNSSHQMKSIAFLETILGSARKYLAWGLLGSSLLHFLIPGVLFF